MALLLALVFLAQTPKPLIHIDPSVVIRRFDPSIAFGAGIDGHETGDNRRMLNRKNADLMKSLGLRSLSNRLRTELGCEVWHWNPEGTWSDAGNRQGYWTSSATASKPLMLTYGFRLPRRGDSLDQANRDDYSRLDDGDPTTFWKSNPYLDPAYTGVPYAKNPQWIVMDFLKPRFFNELVISWGAPYAKRLRLSHTLSKDDEGPWTNAINADVGAPNNGHTILRFKPFRARYLKLELLESSNTGPSDSTDSRDHLGFAVREISAGSTNAKGTFKDEVVHAQSNEKQTLIYVSSTDPWHRETDQDKRIEQPGFDFLLNRGFDQGQSVMLPAGCLYDTPENVANEAAWLKSKGVKIRGIELGEEPDGNWVDGNQYALLYMQMAKAIRKSFPTLSIGGPSFQSIGEDFVDWPHTGKPWLVQFFHELGKRGRLGDFNFCSFEWYPFDDVRADPAVLLPRAVTQLVDDVKRLNGLGMAKVPWYITEYGYSSFGSPVEVNPPGAVFNFDVAMLGLVLGCQTSYLYGYEPNEPIEEVTGIWGNNMVLMLRDDAVIKMPTFWGAWLLTHRLCEPDGRHEMLRVTGASALVGSYAVRGPQGTVNLVLLNRSPVSQSVAVDTSVANLHGWSYGEPQFAWSKVSAHTFPERNLPPVDVSFRPKDVVLPPYSITILTLS